MSRLQCTTLLATLTYCYEDTAHCTTLTATMLLALLMLLAMLAADTLYCTLMRPIAVYVIGHQQVHGHGNYQRHGFK